MKQYEILKKIGVIINELQEQYEFIEQTKEEINDLELELFVANTQFLTEHIEILRKLNQQKPAGSAFENKSKFEEKYFEPVVQPTAKPTIEKPEDPEQTIAGILLPEKTPDAKTVDDGFEYSDLIKAQKAYLESYDQLINQDAGSEEPVDDENFDDTEIVSLIEKSEEPETIQPAKVGSLEVADERLLLNETNIDSDETAELIEVPEITASTTINQMISAQMSYSARLADQLEVQSIKDLKTAISFNEKMLFVRDLFNGYSLSYGEAIEILNRFNKFEEADQFLKVNYVMKNNWAEKQHTADRLYSLLRRRFPA